MTDEKTAPGNPESESELRFVTGSGEVFDIGPDLNNPDWVAVYTRASLAFQERMMYVTDLPALHAHTTAYFKKPGLETIAAMQVLVAELETRPLRVGSDSK